MNCRAFESWLDGGRTASGKDDALRHAESCADCTAAMAAEDALASTLQAALAPARPGFTDQVLSRVAQLAPEETRLAVDPDLVLPWWVQILREPAALLGLILGGLWTVAASAILPLLQSGTLNLSAWPTPSLPAFIAGWSLPFIVAATLVLVGALTFGLYVLASVAFSRMSRLAH